VPTAVPPSVFTKSTGLRTVIEITNYDARAKAAKISRVFLPESARGAGNDDDLSFDVHLVLR
jgi:predicted GNAT family acetyltransferase